MQRKETPVVALMRTGSGSRERHCMEATPSTRKHSVSCSPSSTIRIHTLAEQNVPSDERTSHPMCVYICRCMRSSQLTLRRGR